MGNSEGAQALKLLTTASEEVIEKEMAVTGLHVKLLNKPEFLKVGKKKGGRVSPLFSPSALLVITQHLDANS